MHAYQIPLTNRLAKRMTLPADPFIFERRVEFRDTDAAGIVHFSAFFPMMEAAEHALLRHLGLSVMQAQPDGKHLTWPRVAASCDYVGAARFEEILEIIPVVEHIGTKSVRYGFDIRCQGRTIAQGHFTAVCCLLQDKGLLQSIPIPAEIREKLQQHQGTLPTVTKT